MDKVNKKANGPQGLVFYKNIWFYLQKKLKGTVFKLHTFMKAPVFRARINLFTNLYLGSEAKIKLEKGAIIKGLGSIDIRKSAFFKMEERSVIFRGSEIVVGTKAKLIIKKNTSIGSFSNIRCDGEIIIGNNVLIAQFCSFISGQYEYKKSKNISIGNQGFKTGKIQIEDDVWIGTQVVILPGVKIGRGTVIGAGSVVTHDIPPYAVAVGNPAKVIFKRE